jgi:N-acetylneuraminic acid mutarotase
MATARACHTATLLGSGQVLVAGGVDPSGATLASASLYDPAGDAWSAVGSLATARQFHSATLLPSGHVLAAGGGNPTATATAELYNPVSASWSSTGSLATARSGHSATLLSATNQVLAAGGVDASGLSLASAELYDLTANTWSRAGSLAAQRNGHTAILLGNGLVLVAGGKAITGGGSVAYLASAELFDPSTQTWSGTTSMAAARYGHTATLLASGQVLVCGGAQVASGTSLTYLATAELYDPASATWTATGSMANARYGHTATLLGNGSVLVAGGENQTGCALSSSEIYDPATGVWSLAD